LAHSPFDLKLGNKGSEHTRESKAKRTNSTITTTTTTSKKNKTFITKKGG